MVLRIGEVSGNGRLIVDLAGQGGGKGQNGGQGGDGGNGRNGLPRVCGGDEPQDGGDGGNGGIGGQGGQGGRGGNGGIVIYSEALTPLIKSRHFVIETAGGAPGAGGDPGEAGNPGNGGIGGAGILGCGDGGEDGAPGGRISGAQPGRLGRPAATARRSRSSRNDEFASPIRRHRGRIPGRAVGRDGRARRRPQFPSTRSSISANDQGIRIELDPTDDVLVFNGGTFILWGRNLEIHAGRIQVNADTIIQAFPGQPARSGRATARRAHRAAMAAMAAPGYPGIPAGTVLIRGTSIEGTGPPHHPQ